MDPGTGLVALGAAIGSKELVLKILGPTADYLGVGIKDWTERANKNVGRIFENARKKLGDAIDKDGAVPPKVLKGILNEGQFCDDELAADYFGGVLASSRTEISRDDRGASFIALVSRLSSYQIRSHFLFYRLFRLVHEGHSANIGDPAERASLRLFIPVDTYTAAMEPSLEERRMEMISHVMFGLTRENLIEQNFLFGMPEALKRDFPDAQSAGILVNPSALGVELFLWAHGKGQSRLGDFLDSAVSLISSAKLNILPGTRSVKFLDRVHRKPDATVQR